jgi:hypothetical protein
MTNWILAGPSSSRISEFVICRPYCALTWRIRGSSRPAIARGSSASAQARRALQFPADGAARAGAAGNILAVGMWRKKAQTKAEISPSNARP